MKTNPNNYEKFAEKRSTVIKAGLMKSHRFVEKPMMQNLLEGHNLTGKKLLLIGCGTGEEIDLIMKFGDCEITGIDISEQSIRLAKEQYPDRELKVMDMHNLTFETDTFDFVYSSLTLHYSDLIPEILAGIMRVLKQEGKFVFSVGHPIRWGAEIREDLTGSGVISFDKKSGEIQGNYSSHIKVTHNFPDNEVLEFWSAPPSYYFKCLIASGFTVEQFVESRAIEETKEVDENYYKVFREMPQFVGFLAKK